MVKLFFTIVVLFFGFQVIAETVPPAYPAWQHSIESLLQQMNSGWFAAVALFVIEAIMRVVKTQEPKSLLYIISNGMKLFASLLDQLSKFIDQYIQRLK